MRNCYRAPVVTLLGLGVAFWCIAGQRQDPQPDGAAAKAGEKIDEFGRDQKRHLEC